MVKNEQNAKESSYLDSGLGYGIRYERCYHKRGLGRYVKVADGIGE